MTGLKTNLIFSLLLLSGISGLKCQVCGISGSKLNTSCARVIDQYTLEFENLYAFEKSNSFWDTDGSLIPLTAYIHQSTIGSDLLFRVTFGIFRNTELGAIVDKEGEEASVGFKWAPFTSGKCSVALAGGIRFGFSENTNPPETVEGSIMKTFTAAILLSQEITPSISLDINAGYNIPLATGAPVSPGCLYICSDFGLFLLKGKLQAVIGGGFQSGSIAPGQGKFRIMTLYPGITISTGRNYEILIALPHDLYGINHPKRNSVICALTVTLG